MIGGVPVRVVAPLVAAFVLFLAILAVSIRRPHAAEVRDRGRGAFLRRVVATVGGGYVAFLVIVLVFHRMLAAQRDVMCHAVPAGAALAFAVALPAFVLLSWVEWAVRRSIAKPRSGRQPRH
jgi:Family of unknown function (DUF6256)